MAKGGGGGVPSKDPKFKTTMKEFGAGKLHSGSDKGPVVTNPKQAVAIGINQVDRARKSRGRKRGG